MTTDSASAPQPAADEHGLPPRAAGADVESGRPAEKPRGGALTPTSPARGRMALPVAAGDVLAVAVTCTALPVLDRPMAHAAPMALVLAALHLRRGLYQSRLSCSVLVELPTLAACTVVLWCAAGAVRAASDPGHALSGSALAAAIGTQLVLLSTMRALVYRVRHWRLVRRPRPALVIGRGTDAYQLAVLLQQHPDLGLHPVGLATTHRIPPPPPENRGPALPVLRDRDDVVRALIQNGVQHVVMARSWSAPTLVASDLMRLFDRYGLQVWLVDTGDEDHHMTPAPSFPDQVYGYAAQGLRARPGRFPALYVKRVVDVVLAGAALVVFSPVMAVCALAVRCADGPGVLFRQVRVGQDERAFTLLKFRTLRPTDAHESDTRWNVAGDARMSRVGNFLRRNSLDELPQLWNVVRGDMSLVGPRPERPYFVRKFTQEHPGYPARHRMPTGITGLAQVNGLRGDTSIADRARFDNRYINTWTPWQDICILLRTAGALLRRGGS